MPVSDKHESSADDALPSGSPTGDQQGAPRQPDAVFVYDPLAPEPVPERESASGGPSVPEPGTGAASSPAEESTIGTGTSIALGCVAGSVVLIIIAILVLFIVSVFAN